MVGHTGDLQAAIKACEAVDHCAAKVLDAALKRFLCQFSYRRSR